MSETTGRSATCAWCGRTIWLQGLRKRMTYHMNGAAVCTGSGRAIEVHERMHDAALHKPNPNQEENHGDHPA